MLQPIGPAVLPRRGPMSITPNRRAPAGPRAGAPRGRVLIVEHDRLARQGLTHVLNDCEELCVVGSVAMVREAELLPASLPVDVVLLDADVPDMDGTGGILRLLAHLATTRVVVLSADTSPDVFLTAIRCGADGYLPPTAPAEALRRALIAVLRGEAAIPRALVSVLVDALRDVRQRNATGTPHTSLSHREQEVLAQLTQGRTNAEIAEEMGLTESTIKTHVSNILQKTGSRSRFVLHAAAPPTVSAGTAAVTV